MPAQVREGFSRATRRVPLVRGDLGIVRAVQIDGPALARLNPGDTGLTGSASWIAQFGATESLSVPIRVAGAIVGVVAVSVRGILEPGGTAWKRIEQLAAEAGPGIVAAP
jgi:hypothetical protein